MLDSGFPLKEKSPFCLFVQENVLVIVEKDYISPAEQRVCDRLKKEKYSNVGTLTLNIQSELIVM